MSASVLVAYATRAGSTREVAEAIAAALREAGMIATCQIARETPALDGFDAVVLGAPLYVFKWQKDAKAFLARHRDALSTRPVAIFALGPMNDVEQEFSGAREQLDRELANFPWLKPIAVEIFGGKFDPTNLRFPMNLIPALRKMPASDIRKWDSIRGWASEVVAQIQPRV